MSSTIIAKLCISVRFGCVGAPGYKRRQQAPSDGEMIDDIYRYCRAWETLEQFDEYCPSSLIIDKLTHT